MCPRRFIRVTSTALVLALIGCGTPAASGHRHGLGLPSALCPMRIPGTTVTSEDVEGGGALVYVTSTGDVEDHRRRLRGMVEIHNQENPFMSMPSSTASVEDVKGGARLIFRPKKAAQLEALREYLRTGAAQMDHNECPMPWPRMLPTGSVGPPVQIRA